MEWLTGGECLAGMHEVVVTKRTLEAVALAKEQNRSLWRVSSTVSTLSSHSMLANIVIISRILLDLASYWLTYFLISKQLFSHIASDATLKPLGHFAEATNAPNYPPIYAGE